MKTWTSILAAGAILAFAAPAGNAAIGSDVATGNAALGSVNSSHSMASTVGKQRVKKGKQANAKHTALRVGYGPYGYLGNTAPVGAQASTPRIGP